MRLLVYTMGLGYVNYVKEGAGRRKKDSWQSKSSLRCAYLAAKDEKIFYLAADTCRQKDNEVADRQVHYFSPLRDN